MGIARGDLFHHLPDVWSLCRQLLLQQSLLEPPTAASTDAMPARHTAQYPSYRTSPEKSRASLPAASQALCGEGADQTAAEDQPKLGLRAGGRVSAGLAPTP